ncbi:MAG TPA: SiaB family protein kinase [Flavobacteriales bacterium]|nr:SiaB family protein kinase [Flavobacteriales bacterium]
MEAEAAHSLYRMLGGDRFAFVYAGSFDESLTAQLIPLGEAAAAVSGRQRAQRQRLAFVIVEAYQNITRHRAFKVDGARECSFAVRARADCDSVAAVNPLSNDEAGALNAALGRLRGATSDQLRALFLARLSTGGATARGGAGLGLIEMARKSGQELGHRIVPIDAQRSLFLLHAALSQPGASTGEEKEAMDQDFEIHERAIAMGLTVAMRCGGNTAAQEVLLRILEREISDGASALRAAQAFLASAAWMQEHGLLNEALFCFGMANGRPVTRVVWTAEPGTMAVLTEKAASVAGLSRFELDRLYRSAIARQSDEPQAPDAGLIELIRINRAPLSIEATGSIASFAMHL